MKMTRRQRRQKVKRLTLQGLHQALIARVLGVSAPTVGHDQRALGLPPRIRFEHSTHPYKYQHTFAESLVDEVAKVFFGGELPRDTSQLEKIMTALPETVPDRLKEKMNPEEWRQYRAYFASNMLQAIRVESHRHVN
jgi:hypothetical protein